MRLRLEMLFPEPEYNHMRDISVPNDRWLDDMVYPGGPNSDETSRELGCIKTEMKQGVANKLWDIGKDEGDY